MIVELVKELIEGHKKDIKEAFKSLGGDLSLSIPVSLRVIDDQIAVKVKLQFVKEKVNDNTDAMVAEDQEGQLSFEYGEGGEENPEDEITASANEEGEEE
jgi:hypothetical protein